MIADLLRDIVKVTQSEEELKLLVLGVAQVFLLFGGDLHEADVEDFQVGEGEVLPDAGRVVWLCKR
jgi:hypothetical protein